MVALSFFNSACQAPQKRNDEKEMRLLFDSDDWETHLRGFRLRIDQDGKKRICSMPLLDIIQRFPNLAGEIFFKMVAVRTGTERFISDDEKPFESFESGNSEKIYRK